MKKISKRNKYVGGGMTPYMRTDFNSQLPTQLTAPYSVLQYAPGNAKPTSSANFLQSSNFANMMGGSSSGGGMAGIGQAGDAINSMISNVTGPATASTVSESRMQTAMGTISGTAKGAAAGFAVGGPVGAIVGGVAGLASGIAGKKGSVAISKNPYDDTVDIKYGTGIRGGARNRRKLRRQAEQAQANARSNQASLQMGSMNELEFYEDYDNDILTMAQGGMTSSLAYVDDGELLNTPQGIITEVPEEGKPTDSNLVNLPEGTRILSDKRKVPGSKETFAQMGKRLMSKKKTTRTDKYAENAAMLNEMNDLAIYNKLFAILEGTKVSRKTKNGILAAAGGDVITAANKGRYVKVADRLYRPWNYWEDTYDSTRYTPSKYNTVNTPTAVSNNLNLNNEIQSRVPDEQIATPRRNTPNFFTNASSLAAKTLASDALVNSGEWRGGVPYWLLSATGSPRSTNAELAITNVSTPPATVTTGTRKTTKKNTLIEPVNNELDLSGETISRVGDEVAPYIATTGTTNTTDNSRSNPTDNKNWSHSINDILTDISALAPTISNMYARPEQFNATHNPYESQIRSTMANRKFDISPAKRAIRENRSISNYNAANYNPSTGANLAYRLLSQIAADKAIADLYSTASNVNNQYAGEYANTLNSLGQQRVNATNMAVDMNARSRAAARNIQRTALTQLSLYAQNKQLMKNQKSRDMAMLDMYGPFLEAGYSSKDFASFMKKFKKG
ncbi:hypothetical protein [uncultured phage cr60_1]|uniref:Uncharacterized protein n=1 Tax=uncultured phage cr60_1 TaxID=2772082 RepID=A0A7M1RRM4_9CAUD|nr:hypothetical protein KNV49_gp29 [uncultured phage cr60_1]QOR56968.1 hypothetical protein [uncultured phage cr60_1]